MLLAIKNVIIFIMKIFIGTDHAGYTLKEKLVSYLILKGHEVIDKGAFKYNEIDDYPDFIVPVAREISKDPDVAKGIILGSSGEGEAMVANRFLHVRAVVYYGKPEDAERDMIIIRSREHNNANILSLGAAYLSEETMINAVNLWLETPFTKEERHVRRLAKIDEIKIEKNHD